MKNHLLKFRNAFFLITVLILSGCAYSVHQVNAGDFSAVKSLKGAKKITAEGKRKYIIAKFDNDYVEDAYRRLTSQCKGGKITGVSAVHMTNLGFFSWDDAVIFEGYCIR